MRLESGDYVHNPRLQQLLLNTTVALQTVTRRQEILGSSDGSKNQSFWITQPPVLAKQALIVRETELPPAAEQAAIEQSEGADAITITPAGAGQPAEIWVRWHAVPDFYGYRTDWTATMFSTD